MTSTDDPTELATTPSGQEAASAAFPLAPRREKGYAPAAVDAFLQRARDAFEADDAGVRDTRSGDAASWSGDGANGDGANGEGANGDAEDPSPSGAAAIDSVWIRRAAFPLVRGGYLISAVDAAVARIEDAFAARERDAALSRKGARAWVGRSRNLAQEILDRLSRPRRRRFDRVGLLSYGYRVDEVDIVADRIARYLESGEPLTVEQVRSVAFRMQRGGYREAQVDAVLDAVVEVILAIG